jgi:hypothetical protein
MDRLLTEIISKRLCSHKSCTVFENELSRVFPYDDKARQQRHTLIRAFAKAHGWSATILDPGIRVTFRKLKEGETEDESTDLAEAG